MDIIKLVIKILSPFFLIVLFNFLEYGFKWNRIDQFVYPLVLMLVTLLIFFIPKLRKLFLISGYILLDLSYHYGAE